MNRTIDIEQEIANQGIPTSMQATYRKALAGNRPAAVKAMCWHCQGWTDARKAIRDCADVGCPLHAVRPYQAKSDITSGPEDETAPERPLSAGILLGGAASSALESHTSAVLNALSTTEWQSKSEILFLSRIDPEWWNETIQYLLSQGLVERQGERRFTKYRKL